jgi:hypothetical protein
MQIKIGVWMGFLGSCSKINVMHKRFVIGFLSAFVANYLHFLQIICICFAIRIN